MSTFAAQDGPVRVLVCDMAPLVAIGIRCALRKFDDFHIEAASMQDILQMDRDPFDVVVTDYNHGVRYASPKYRLDASASVKNAHMFVLTCDSSQQDVRHALELGVHGIATMDLQVDELRKGVRAVSRGERYVCAAAARRLAESMSRETLTCREVEVLRELARGSCNKTIARTLDVSVGTIKSHMRALMSKLDAGTRTQVITTAIARGLVKASGSPSIRNTTRLATRHSSEDQMATSGQAL